MHRYEASIRWQRNGEEFADGRYSRGHEWSFDGGTTVPASASPLSVRAPFSVAEAVDPEEALVAATSSCHMLTFLFLAAKRGFVVDSYTDDADGVMEKNDAGKLAVTRITLRPVIAFSGKAPSDDELRGLHHAAHEECYIANSIRSEIVVEGVERP
jgi:organic hydroperoxide reductase OsmC/OhrA